MYSVLIQNQKTMESFHRFRPIFMNALNQGVLDACLWIETGTSIDTAAPELYDLIQDKEEWRAIIVRIEDGPCMQQFQAAAENPYDFSACIPDDGAVRESDVPLIRLTHMLAGVPTPSIDFNVNTIKEPGKDPRVVYTPEIDCVAQQAYNDLCKKYRFHGPRPREIILVSLRAKSESENESIRESWRNNNETDRSGFWRRNNYPSLCRFACVDIEDKGVVQRAADLFSVWMAVMLLATNTIDPSTFQAYALHQVSVIYDRNVLQEVMQETVSRSLCARHYIQKGLQREMETEIKEDVIIPDYAIHVPIVLKLPSNKDVNVDPKAFHLTSKTPISDSALWREMQEKAERELDGAILTANRALEQGADIMRTQRAVCEEDVYPLSKYQAEDMALELGQLHRKIYRSRTDLPEELSADRRTMAELSKPIKEYIYERLTRMQGLLCLALAVGAIGLCLLPALFVGKVDGLLLLAVFLLCGVAFAVAEVIPLFIQMLRLRGALKSFNHFSSGILTRASENAAAHSRYMSDVGSFMRGNSFLTWVKRKNYFRDEAQFYKRNHILALSGFLQQLKEWCTAFHLTVSFDMAEMDDRFVVDTDLAPQLNPLYTFEDDNNYFIPLNSTGDMIESPFRFVQRFKIRREELYDDAN